MKEDFGFEDVVLPGYEPLAYVLHLALMQSQAGKGKDRHASDGKPFLGQSIMEEARACGIGFPIGQSRKKAREAIRLKELYGIRAAQDELLGAIVYLAAAWLRLGEIEDAERKVLWEDKHPEKEAGR